MSKKIKKYTEEEWVALNNAVPSKQEYPEKDEIIVETIINKMFEIAGHAVTFEDIKGRTDNWYQQWTMTEEQNKEWREWGVKYLKKSKYLAKKYYADRQMAMFDLNYGLKIKQNEKEEQI